MRITKTKLWLIVSLLVLLLILGTNIFLNYKYKGLLDDVNEFSLQINESKAKSNELNAIETNIRSTTSDKDKLSSFFISKDGIIGFIENLEALMKESNVTGEVKDVSDKTTVSGPNGATYFDFTVTFYGKWEDVVQYLAMIENLPNLVSIESLALTYGEENSKSKVNKDDNINVWKAILSLKVGTFPQVENDKK